MLSSTTLIFVFTHKKEMKMKKLVLLILICILPNILLAKKEEWPVFSNKNDAVNSLFMLKWIISNYPKHCKIDNYHYTIDPASCDISFNPEIYNNSQTAEYKIAEPSELDVTENTANYALFIDNEKIDESNLILTRSEVIDIATIDDLGNIQPHSENPLPTTKKKKRKTKKEEKNIEDEEEKTLHDNKIKKEKTNSLIINELPITPIPVSRTKSTHKAKPDSEVKNTFEAKQQEIIENTIIENNIGKDLVDTTKKKNNCCSIL